MVLKTYIKKKKCFAKYSGEIRKKNNIRSHVNTIAFMTKNSNYSLPSMWICSPNESSTGGMNGESKGK